MTSATAYESSYPATPVRTFEVKELPATHVLEAETPCEYFDRGNQAFMTLFRYIQRNKVSMTVPVEAEMKPGKMRFFVGRDVTRELPSGTGGVTVRALPAPYPEWIPAGDPYAVYWNSPFVPWFAKRSEIHIPVTAVP